VYGDSQPLSVEAQYTEAFILKLQFEVIGGEQYVSK
jgi:hypothetical protein